MNIQNAMEILKHELDSQMGHLDRMIKPVEAEGHKLGGIQIRIWPEGSGPEGDRYVEAFISKEELAFWTTEPIAWATAQDLVQTLNILMRKQALPS